MGAQPPHMDKYIEPYRRLFPSSPILVLRSEAGDWLNPWKKPSMDAAATVVQSLYDASELAPASASVPHSPTDPDLVIHVWSNGGSASLARLRQSLAKQRAALPPYTLVLDSTPGQFSYRGTFSAFSLVAPKKWAWLLRPLLHGFVAWFWLLTYVRARLDFRRRAEVGEAQAKGKSKLFGPLALLAASHNTAAVRAREARRTYIYSREDALIPYTDVEEHGADARGKGFNVRMEEFKGTAHVAHARTEPERYWEIVRETWEGRPYVRDAAAEEEVKAEAAAAEGKEEEVTAVEQHVTA
ncbi:hypothetical protein CC85DRAFT_284223 [Cutaneotrichosporon oleaginosum]|uniref:DUF829-domain-containing protein n=1 Tax=Cutaneotrichosporon oleaginosum TaxID=879819 RepID=A0A0J0XRL6_9TREE|nr:uncharacterized protein CC85DRAFT_284223 [Cutaneotrichosporon oleaginosum]KLT43712.1 hypothetical protein CC85DRAFT_284223 [Cutaneotrichosporon oleaginosum]TXT05130.1 hypothetical protein COLE_06450 [Cutaneotrichosporon oleaginosum]